MKLCSITILSEVIQSLDKRCPWKVVDPPTINKIAEHLREIERLYEALPTEQRIGFADSPRKEAAA